MLGLAELLIIIVILLPTLFTVGLIIRLMSTSKE